MPRFKHDCTNPECCIYIGQTPDADVYTYRNHGTMERGLILRFSDRREDNHTYFTLSYAASMNDPTVAAALRLIEHKTTAKIFDDIEAVQERSKT